jgi:hypothetical protein
MTVELFANNTIVLTSLLDQVPPKAQAAIQHAISASEKEKASMLNTLRTIPSWSNRKQMPSPTNTPTPTATPTAKPSPTDRVNPSDQQIPPGQEKKTPGPPNPTIQQIPPGQEKKTIVP